MAMLCLKVMAKRIQTMRTTLRHCLENLHSSFNWEHITDQVWDVWFVIFIWSYNILEESYYISSTQFYTLMHIQMQVGMFCFSGLTPDQVQQMEKLFHIYMTPDGRMRYSLKEILILQPWLPWLKSQFFFSSFVNLIVITALENILILPI